MEYFIHCEIDDIYWLSIFEHDYVKFCEHLTDLGYIRKKSFLGTFFDERVWFDSFVLMRDSVPYKLVIFKLVEKIDSYLEEFTWPTLV